MQMALALGSQLVAGGTSLTGIAQSTLAAAGGGTLTAGKISAGASALSALSNFAGGMAQSRELEQQALFARAEARQSTLQAQQEQNEILDEALTVMARQRVAFSAAGVDAFSGSAEAAVRQTEADAERDMQIAQDDGLARYLIQRRSGSALMRRARAARSIGAIAAGADIANATARLRERG